MGANFAKSIEDLPTGTTELFQGVINTATTGISITPDLFLWRQVPFMGNIGEPVGVINNSFNPAATAPAGDINFQIRSWDYDPATFTITCLLYTSPSPRDS